MAFHPRENWNPVTRRGQLYTRRDFLVRAAKLGIAIPALPTVLAACLEREPFPPANLAIGSIENPVRQPLFDDNQPIASGLQPEGGPLKIYNWADYINPEIVPVIEEALGVEVRITTFFNEEEAIGRLAYGDVSYDVWFPTSQRLAAVVGAKLIQPLNHDYLPNLPEYVWPELVDPYYDQGSQYSVPYVLYTNGVAWRTDMADSEDIEGLANPWDVFWNPKYRGQMGLLDSLTDTLGMALLRNGVANPTEATEEQLYEAGDSLLELIDLMNVRYTIDGAYSGIPEGRFALHHAWAGDMINSQYYWAEDADISVTRYVWPANAPGSTTFGAISNDTMAIPRNAEHPVLAHQFLDFMLNFDNSLFNFEYLGYQPPQIELTPEYLINEEWVADFLEPAIIEQSDFFHPQAWVQGPLTTEQEQLWSRQWNRATSGG